MGVSISSTSTFLLPTSSRYMSLGALCSEVLHCDLAERFGPLVFCIFSCFYIPAKFYYFAIVSIYTFLDPSLSTPVSRLWGKSCTSSNLLFPICTWNVHVLNWRVPDIFLSDITPFPFQPSCIHVQIYRSFTINSTFETMGEVLHIVFNFSLPFFSWNVHVSFCWTQVLVHFYQVTLLPFLAAEATRGRRETTVTPASYASPLSVVVFSFFSVGQFHRAPSGCILAAFPGAHTFSISMQLISSLSLFRCCQGFVQESWAPRALCPSFRSPNLFGINVLEYNGIAVNLLSWAFSPCRNIISGTLSPHPQRHILQRNKETSIDYYSWGDNRSPFCSHRLCVLEVYSYKETFIEATSRRSILQTERVPSPMTAFCGFACQPDWDIGYSFYCSIHFLYFALLCYLIFHLADGMLLQTCSSKMYTYIYIIITYNMNVLCNHIHFPIFPKNTVPENFCWIFWKASQRERSSGSLPQPLWESRSPISRPDCQQ